MVSFAGGHAMNFADLAVPFPADDVEWRVQQAGETNGRMWAIVVPYVTNRAIQQRLDEVAGPENWRNEFLPGPGGGVMCGIYLRIPREDGSWEWVGKFDGAPNSSGDSEMAVKGGFSGAMKRAAVEWSIGRYLYALDEGFAEVSENGKHRAKTKDGKSFRWNPPKLPRWALPAPTGTASGSVAEDGTKALLEYITTHANRVGKGAVVMIEGNERNFREYVQSNWSAILSTPSIAEAVAKVVEKETRVER
jgi:hypothetical protein